MANVTIRASERESESEDRVEERKICEYGWGWENCSLHHFVLHEKYVSTESRTPSQNLFSFATARHPSHFHGKSQTVICAMWSIVLDVCHTRQ